MQIPGDALHPLGKARPVRRIRAVKQVIALRLGKVLPLLVQREQAGLGVLPPVPVVHVEGRQIGHALVPGLLRVDASLDVHRHDLADAGALRAHAVGIIEGKVGRRAHMGRADARIEQAQRGVHVADGAHGGAGVAAQPGLIHDHRGGEVVDALHLRLFILGQPSPHERGVGFVHLPLTLGGDGVKHDAGFAGAGNPGEYHDLSLGNVQRDILQVVLPKAPDHNMLLLIHVNRLAFFPIIAHRARLFSTFLAEKKGTRRICACSTCIPIHSSNRMGV